MNQDDVVDNGEIVDGGMVDADTLPDNMEHNKSDNGITMPEPLLKLFILRLSIAVLSVVIAIVTTIVLKDITCLGILLIAAYFAFSSLYSIQYRYMHGFIIAVPVTCAAVQASSLTKNIRVSFESIDNPHHMFQFLYGSKKSSSEFIINATYIIYYDISSPDDLIAYNVA